MLNSVAAGRRTAFHALACQACAVLLVAAAFLVQGPLHAAGAAVGGAAMLLGNLLAVAMAFGVSVPTRAVPAGAALVRLMLGALAKWCTTMGVLAVALAVWRLPALPVVVGLSLGLAAYLAALGLTRGTASAQQANSENRTN